MDAIGRSERFFHAYEETLRQAFPDLWGRVAAGVFGPGSDNFGFDDEISLDHDVDPGFFLFLGERDYQTWELKLSRAYDRLPRDFEGLSRIGDSAYGTARHGVRELGAFFREVKDQGYKIRFVSVPERYINSTCFCQYNRLPFVKTIKIRISHLRRAGGAV